MSGDAHVRFRERLGVRFPRATRLVVGFEHEADARRFWDDMRKRFEEFSLSLNPDKTRLIEFGRFAAERRATRGLGKPETFNFAPHRRSAHYPPDPEVVEGWCPRERGCHGQ